MAISAPYRSASFEADYEAHREYGLEYLRRHWRQFNAHDREDIVDEVFRSLVERELNDGFVPAEFRPYFCKALGLRAKHELRKRNGRATDASDPHAGALAQVGDQGIDEQVIGKLDAENLTAIIEALNPLQRACAHLRFHCELMPREIADQLGVERRKVDKALERATAKIRKRVDEGNFGKHYGELIDRLVAGTATPRQRVEALALIRASSQARMIHAAMLRDGRDVGAELAGALIVTHEPTRSRLADLLAHTKQQLIDVGQTAKGQATSAYVRTADTTQGAGQYLSSARPGAAAALVATCLTLSGGVTICAVNGVDPIDAFRDRPAGEKKSPKRDAGNPVAKLPAALPGRPQPARENTRPAAPKPRPSPRPPAPTGTARVAPSAGGTNLGGLGGSPGVAAPAPASGPAPSPTPAPRPASATQPAPATAGGDFGGLSP